MHFIKATPYHCRYGDEEKLASIFGVMQALVSFVQSDSTDSLKYVLYSVVWYVLYGTMKIFLLDLYISSYHTIPYHTMTYHTKPNHSRYITAGRHKFVFQIKDPLILVIVAQTGEPEPLVCKCIFYCIEWHCIVLYSIVFNISIQCSGHGIIILTCTLCSWSCSYNTCTTRSCFSSRTVSYKAFSSAARTLTYAEW